MSSSKKMESAVREPFEYLNSLPGKSLRSKLIECFNLLIGASESDKNSIASAIEILHTASLMIDDIEDDASVRRNSECAHLKFGLARTLNSANLAYFDALRLVSDIPNCAFIFSEHMIRLHTGQGAELYFREAGLRPTMEEYFQICRLKTGGLLALSVQLLASKKGRHQPVLDKLIFDIAEGLGLYYQLRDDFCNIFRSDASDLIEGKFTLPTLLAGLDKVKCFNSEEIEEVKRELDGKQSELECIKTLKCEESKLLSLIDQLAGFNGADEAIKELKKIIYSLRIWSD